MAQLGTSFRKRKRGRYRKHKLGVGRRYQLHMMISARRLYLALHWATAAKSLRRPLEFFRPIPRAHPVALGLLESERNLRELQIHSTIVEVTHQNILHLFGQLSLSSYSTNPYYHTDGRLFSGRLCDLISLRDGEHIAIFMAAVSQEIL